MTAGRGAIESFATRDAVVELSPGLRLHGAVVDRSGQNWGISGRTDGSIRVGWIRAYRQLGRETGARGHRGGRGHQNNNLHEEPQSRAAHRSPACGDCGGAHPCAQVELAADDADGPREPAPRRSGPDAHHAPHMSWPSIRLRSALEAGLALKVRNGLQGLPADADWEPGVRHAAEASARWRR